MKAQHPPKLAKKLFSWTCGPAAVEDLEGDLDELYSIRVNQKGPFRAKLSYWIQILSLCFSYALRKRKSDASYSSYYGSGSMTMLSNYIKISYRNLKKQKVFTVLNIIGLAMGMSISLLALAMLVELNQFEKFHEDADRIYRVITTLEKDGNKINYASAPQRLTSLIREQMPQIEESVSINDRFQA